MEQVLASHSVAITELKRTPHAELEHARLAPAPLLNHNRPFANLLSPAINASMLKRLNADLRGAIQQGIDSGPAIAAEDVFAELTARYAKPKLAANETDC